MQAVVPVLPQLDDVRDDEVAAPGRRQRRLVSERGEVGDALLQPRAALDDLALRRGRRRQPAAEGPRRPVRGGFLARDLLDRALDAELAAERVPMEHHGRPGLRLELAALARAVVRVEDEVAGVGDDLLAEHDARRRPPVFVRGRKAHRVRVALDLLVGGLPEPGGSERHGVRRKGVREGLERRVHGRILAPGPVKRRFSLAGRNWRQRNQRRCRHVETGPDRCLARRAAGWNGHGGQ